MGWTSDQKHIRNIILLLSLFFFCLQCKQALEHLNSPQLIDSTQIQDIEKIFQPIITICPTNQLNTTKLGNLGYSNSLPNLYLGKLKIEKNKTKQFIVSWESLNNISFSKILEQIYDQKAAKSMYTYSHDSRGYMNKIQTEIIFLPKYGFCKRIDKYNPNHEITISSRYSFHMLITDPIYSSFVMPNYTSMRGNTIVANLGNKYYFDVRVSVLKVCKDFNTTSFKTCVDDRLQKVFLPTMGCIPPWLSKRNQCNGHYPLNFTRTSDYNYRNKYVTPALTLKNLEEEHICKKFCVFTSTEPRLYIEEFSNRKKTRAQIFFQKEVSVTEKIPNYDFFKFIIDTGSSLGLWLGLSILGLWDLLTDSIQLIRSFKLSKML